MRPRWLLAVVTTLGLAVAACSGGDDQSSDTTAPTTVPATASTTAAPATTAAPTTAPPTTELATTAPATTAPATTAPAITVTATTAPDDPRAAIAASALLTVDDFSEGWTAVPPGDDAAAEDDDEGIVFVADCAGVELALLSDDVLGTTRATSPTFTTTDDTFAVDHSAGFAADEATAIAAAAAVADPDVPGCYGDGIVEFFTRSATATDPADTLPPGMEIGEVTTSLGDLTPFALQADDAIWFHVGYPLTIQGQTFEQHADFVFLRNGDALSRLMLTGFGETFPPDDIAGIVQLADARLAAIA